MSERDQELNLRQRLSALSRLPLLRGVRVSGEAARLQRQLDRLSLDTSDEAIWRSVELARHPDRPYTLDYVARILTDWVELHGDRGRADDGALVTGLGSLNGRTVALIGHQKGRDVKERLERQFGMAYPEGYHKAIRVMEIAERFGFPVISLIDTPGAYPGVAAEQHGQGGAIARSQAVMSRLTVPDGRLRHRRGRLGRRDRDRRLGQGPDAGERDLLGDHPRGLRRDSLARRRPGEEGCRGVQARCAALPGSRRDRRGRSGAGGRRSDRCDAAAAAMLKAALVDSLEELDDIPGDELRRRRRAKFRGMGVYA